MAVNAGTIFVDLQARIGKFKNNLKKAQTEMGKFAKKTSSFVSANRLAIAGVFVGVGAAIIKVNKAASDLQETQAKFDTVFRGSTAEAEQWAQVLRDSYFMSENAAKNYLASIQDTLVPMGLARDDAAKLSNNIVQLAADLGSFNNVDTATVVRDLQSALVGNTETVKKYGVVLKATDIANRAMADSGKKSVKQLTNAEKVTAAYQLILEGTADAQGDMARTSDSFANQQKKLNAVLEDLSTTVGQFTIGPMTSLASKAADFVKELDTGITTIQEAKTEFDGWGGVIRNTVVLALGELIKSIIDFQVKMMGLGPVFKLLGVDMSFVKDKIDEQAEAWQAGINKSEKATKKVVAGEKEKQAAIKETTAELTKEQQKRDEETERIANIRIERWMEQNAEFLEGERKKQEELTEIEEKADEERKSRLDEWRDVFTTSQEEMVGFVQGLIQGMFTQFGDGIADMILENRKFSDVIKAIWKDLARAVIAQIAKMIVEWLMWQAIKASATGGIGAFFAKGGIINEPSVITGLRSGTTSIAGEAGPEVIMPMQKFQGGKKNQAMNTANLRDSSGLGGDEESGGGGSDGGNITINISGSFIEGSRAKWQQLIRDTIVPELRRRTMADPRGLFNRKRGATV